jgi:hypothetical protein
MSLSVRYLPKVCIIKQNICVWAAPILCLVIISRHILVGQLGSRSGIKEADHNFK